MTHEDVVTMGKAFADGLDAALAENEEVYRLTEWGCLVCTLHQYGIDVSGVTPTIGQHMVEDFLKLMARSGYIAEAEE